MQLQLAFASASVSVLPRPPVDPVTIAVHPLIIIRPIYYGGALNLAIEKP